MEKYIIEYKVLASGGEVSSKYRKEMNTLEQAENYRKSEEAAIGFEVEMEVLESPEGGEDLEVGEWSTKGGFGGDVETSVTDKSDTETSENDKNVDDDVDEYLYDMYESERLEDSLFADEENEDDYPRGWHRRKEFVSKYGKYYEQGDEVKEKFRTEEPSDY